MSRLLKAVRIPIVDADIIARQVVEFGTSALAKIQVTFGNEVLFPDGGLLFCETCYTSLMPTPLGNFPRVLHKSGIPVGPFRLQITSPNGKPFITLMIGYNVILVFHTFPLES